MNKNRLEAFSDGVIAIIITIMVLEIKMPNDTSLDSIKSVLPSLGSYLLSFVFIAIYWGNHHHLLHTLQKVNGKVLWANLHLLFWLSLIPVGTAWMANTNYDSVAVAIYGALLVACGMAYSILGSIIGKTAKESELTKAFEKMRVKGMLSSILYISSIPLAFVNPYISCAIFASVGLMWVIPNKDVERILGEE
ncbi:MAG: TMEM175 family protein [bacterium]